MRLFYLYRYLRGNCLILKLAKFGNFQAYNL
jgi:hypothetical protein